MCFVFLLTFIVFLSCTAENGLNSDPIVENSLILCNDSLDNDGDSFIDCLDQDCKVFTFCAVTQQSSSSSLLGGVVSSAAMNPESISSHDTVSVSPTAQSVTSPLSSDNNSVPENISSHDIVSSSLTAQSVTSPLSSNNNSVPENNSSHMSVGSSLVTPPELSSASSNQEGRSINLAPLVTDIIAKKYVVTIGDSVTFWAEGSDPNGFSDITQYQWDLNGDGVFEYTETTQLFKRHVITVAYDTPGDYTLDFKIIDKSGAEVLASQSIQQLPQVIVINEPPTLVDCPDVTVNRRKSVSLICQAEDKNETAEGVVAGSEGVLTYSWDINADLTVDTVTTGGVLTVDIDYTVDTTIAVLVTITDDDANSISKEILIGVHNDGFDPDGLQCIDPLPLRESDSPTYQETDLLKHRSIIPVYLPIGVWGYDNDLTFDRISVGCGYSDDCILQVSFDCTRNDVNETQYIGASFLSGRNDWSYDHTWGGDEPTTLVGEFAGSGYLIIGSFGAQESIQLTQEYQPLTLTLDYAQHIMDQANPISEDAPVSTDYADNKLFNTPVSLIVHQIDSTDTEEVIWVNIKNLMFE